MRSLVHAVPFALVLTFAASAIAEPVMLSHRDRLYGVARLEGRTFIVGHPGLLLRSDAGKAAFVNVEGGQTDEALFSIAFNTKGQGAVVGRSGVVLTTEDKGEHWQKTFVDLQGDKPSLFGVEVLEDGTVVAVGEFGTIVRSEDRGKSWARATYDAALPATPADQLPKGCAEQEAENENSDMIQEARLTGVDFADDKHGLISAEFGMVLASSDGGRTFTRQNTCIDTMLFAVRAVSETHRVAVGAGGVAIETKDGGRTWTVLDTGTVEHLFGIWANGTRTVFTGAAGAVLTRGAGEDFQKASSGVHSWLVSVDLDDSGAGLIVGGRATALKTSDGGNTLTRILGE